MVLSPEVLQELREVPTGSISDAFDRLGVVNGIVVGLKPNFLGARIVGTAVTIRQLPARTGESSDPKWELIEDIAQPGDVLVWDVGGETKFNTLGGNVCLAAQLKGIVGAIVDGTVRDYAETRANGFPIFSRGFSAITGTRRYYGTCVNEPVTIVDVQVRAGDIIVADEDGVAVIPPRMLNETLNEVRDKEKFDKLTQAELRKGSSWKKILELVAKQGIKPP